MISIPQGAGGFLHHIICEWKRAACLKDALQLCHSTQGLCSRWGGQKSPSCTLQRGWKGPTWLPLPVGNCEIDGAKERWREAAASVNATAHFSDGFGGAFKGVPGNHGLKIANS